MPFTITIMLANDTATFAVGNTKQTKYTLYNQNYSAQVKTQYSNVFTGLYDADYAVRAEQANADGTVDSDYQEFTVQGSTVSPFPTFGISQEPEFLQAVYNPVLVTMVKTDYRIGNLFFVEIWTVPTKNVLFGTRKDNAVLLRTERQNGTGTGVCTTDLSGALQSVFRADNYTVPNGALPFQKDESAYQAYYFKAGHIAYDEQNREIRTYVTESDVKYVLRAGLPYELGSGDMSLDYCYQFDGEPVRYLTTIPNLSKRKPGETTYLPYFMALNSTDAGVVNRVFAVADMVFTDGTSVNGYVFGDFDMTAGGGVYLVDVKPERLLAHPRYAELVKYGVYLQYFDDTEAFTFTQTKEFRIGEDVQTPAVVQFMNTLGAWDSIQFTRNFNRDMKTKAAVFTNGYGSKISNVDTTTTITFNSGWLLPEEDTWLEDMKASPALYINDKYYRQADTTYKFNSTIGLTNIELSVSPAYEKNTIKL